MCTDMNVVNRLAKAGWALLIWPLLLLGMPATAAVVTYTDRASWEAAAQNVRTSILFPTIADGAWVDTLVLDGGTVLGLDQAVRHSKVDGWGLYDDVDGDVFFTEGFSSLEATIVNSGGFGLHVGGLERRATITLTLSDGTVMEHVSVLAGAENFFGWIGDGITGFSLDGNSQLFLGHFVEVDGEPTPIPEPASIALLGLAALRRRRNWN